ncbi:hypothetical protein SAMD00019534_021120, partial [Acytostelium subglobosum LB1]|uniref:hypothetical protein n=1 Tax=Acytostelium subglobosum LB1 TaxID=1410327 RepID=UPI000644D78B
MNTKFISCLLLVTLMVSSCLATIKVTNNYGIGIEAAVNQWGSSGSTNFFPISANNGYETWSRSDSKPFIVAIKIGTTTAYVPTPYNGEIVVNYDGSIKANGVNTPLSSLAYQGRICT